jgi:heme o synthase
MTATLKNILSVFKLRIGVTIMLTALAGLAMAPAPAPEAWRIAVLALAVLLSSASAGAFNQYAERDLDAHMPRTRGRPFVTGAFRAHAAWPAGIILLLAASVAMAWWALNPAAAIYVFLGAFVYGFVYTVWLKRRSWTNIVVGGLAGSFAVLAGAAAADPVIAPAPALLALALFLWTPPHFWSLAMALRDDYAAAGVPMLPVVIGDARAAWVILGHTVALVAVTLVPVFYGLGWFYFAASAVGGIWFITRSVQLVRAPGRNTAMANFFASLIQLSLVLVGAYVDAWLFA